MFKKDLKFAFNECFLKRKGNWTWKGKFFPSFYTFYPKIYCFFLIYWFSVADFIPYPKRFDLQKSVLSVLFSMNCMNRSLCLLTGWMRWMIVEKLFSSLSTNIMLPGNIVYIIHLFGFSQKKYYRTFWLLRALYSEIYS